MDLQTYLKSSRAVEDVRALLIKDPWATASDGAYRAHAPQGSYVWRDEPCWAWRKIGLDFGEDAVIACYYRHDGNSGFVVSDCGESVRDVMRRTAKPAYRAIEDKDAALHMTLQGTVFELSYADEGCDITLHPIQKDDLPAAILHALQTVARVRAGLGVG